MRFSRRLLGVVLLLALLAMLAACDTTQPLQVSSQTLTLDITGVNALTADFYDVSDGQEDTDLDGVADGPIFSWCLPPAFTLGQTPIDSVPISFALEVLVIRAGETTPVRISPDLATNPNENLAQYDTKAIANISVQPQDICLDATPAVVPCTDPSVARRFKFSNARVNSIANRAVAGSTSNPLSDALPGTFGFGNGLCSIFDPGESSVVDEPLPYAVDIEKGDTVIFTIQRGVLNPGVGGMFTPAELSADLKLDGASITPIGDTSTLGTNDTISFRFTAQ